MSENKLEIGIYYYKTDEGQKILDIEVMREEFAQKVQGLLDSGEYQEK